MTSTAAAEAVNEKLDTLSTTAGVVGVVVCDANGIPIRDTFPDIDRSQALQYAQMANGLVQEAWEVVKDEGGVASLRVRTKTYELLIRANERYRIVVVQDPGMGV